jgi:hypothetical protein
MYTTVKSLHVALDIKIQQIASNRKKSILPQQMDMILNEAVNEFISTRLSDKMNIRKTGLDDEVQRYDDLSELKREYSSKLYVDEKYAGKRMYTLLPSDYLHYIMSESMVLVNKQKMFPETEKYYYTVGSMLLTDLKLNEDYLDIYINHEFKGKYDNVYKNTKSTSGSFYCFNTIVDKYRSFGWHCYLNDYRNRHVDTTIFVTDFNLKPVTGDTYEPQFHTAVKTSDSCPDNFMYFGEAVKLYSQSGNTIGVNELMSSEKLKDNMHNHFAGKNRYLQPMVEMQNKILYVYYDDYFVPTDIKITYIKQPRMINIDTETLCELTVTDAILEIAARKAISYLGIGQQYQVRANEMQLTN